MAVRDAVRARELYFSGSRRYQSFWKMVYSDEQWKGERHQVYGPRSVKSDCDVFLTGCRKNWTRRRLSRRTHSPPACSRRPGGVFGWPRRS